MYFCTGSSFLFFVFCFSFPCQAYEAGCGRDNCCPLDVEAGRLTISRDPYPIAVFHSDSKKWLWQKHRHLSVYLSLSRSLSQALFTRDQMISISSPFSLSSLWMPTSGESEPAKASSCLPMLQWDWPTHHTWYKECSVNHTSTVWNRKWGIQAGGWCHLESGIFCLFVGFIQLKCFIHKFIENLLRLYKFLCFFFPKNIKTQSFNIWLFQQSNAFRCSTFKTESNLLWNKLHGSLKLRFCQ